MDNMLQSLYNSFTGETNPKYELIVGSGSNRQYYRIYGESKTCIGVKGESLHENRAFITLAKHFKQKGLPVPEIYAVSSDEKYYLQEDLGKISLFDLIQAEKEGESIELPLKETLIKTIRLLPHFQYKGAEDLDFSVCYPVSEFNRKAVYWDLNYFKYCFLKPSGIDFSESGLEADFDKLAGVLSEETGNTFLFRDFQSRNVILKNGEPFFIDFQGGRRGPVYYDLASFVWQAKANFSEEEKKYLIDAYLSELRKYTNVDIDDFYNKLNLFVLFRTLHVLGAYGFRGHFEIKPHFLESIPFALHNIEELLKKGFPEYPHLSDILSRLVDEQLKKEALEASETSLTVRIFSFSYKKGIPKDESGHGGGFVFDCRAGNNPGRFIEYKYMNGLDAPVQKFLEDDGEILSFLEHAFAMADISVRRYIERNFTHLMFCFGCTGGQHRSVYAAQKLAEYLNRKYNIKIELVLREQNIKSTF